jgi:hypothetical protein
MTKRVLAAVLTLLSSVATAAGQTRPDFTGTWQMDMSRSESAAQRADASPSGPVTVAIEQSTSQVVIDTNRDGQQQEVRYTFDGNDPRPVGTSGSDEVTLQPAGAQWRGEELITTTMYRVNGMAVKQVQTRRLAADGREMHVETRLDMQHGYETNHPEYKSGSVVRDVFTRK